MALNSVNESCKNVLPEVSVYQNKVTFYSVFGSNLKWLCFFLSFPYRGSTVLRFICLKDVY